MASKTAGKLELWLVDLADKIADTWNTYIRENFIAIDNEFENIETKLTSKASMVNFSTELTTAWTGTEAPFSKAQTVTGILSTDTPIIDIIMSGTFETDEKIIDEWGKIYRAVTLENQITFYATEKPAVALPLQIKVVR